MRHIVATVKVSFETNDEGTPDELAEKYVDDFATNVYDLFGPEWFDPENANGWILDSVVYATAEEDNG